MKPIISDRACSSGAGFSIDKSLRLVKDNFQLWTLSQTGRALSDVMQTNKHMKSFSYECEVS